LTEKKAENYRNDSKPGVIFSSLEAANAILIKDGKAEDRKAARQL